MPWPLSQDYNEAIQSPATSLGDPELQGGAPVASPLGLPMPRSGSFADVYEFVGASGAKWAIKCFTRAVPGLRERYTEISKHLIQAKLPFTVDFEFLARGIRIRGDWYPVLKMQWVEGFLLNEFVRNNLDKPALLEGLGEIWLRMAKCMRDANIAHADLQHGNVLLVAKSSKAGALAVKLIDYDGMWVPGLANKKSGEVGHPNYQHPQRLRQGAYTAEVDRLPLLVVACAFRALVVGGRPLWDRYDNGDNLLFREVDLRAPDTSALFRELRELPDPQLRTLVEELRKALARRLEDAPPINEFMRETEPRAPFPATAITLTVPNPSVPPTMPAPPWDYNQPDPAEPQARRTSIPLWGLLTGGAVAAAAVAMLCISIPLTVFLWSEKKNPNLPPIRLVKVGDKKEEAKKDDAKKDDAKKDGAKKDEAKKDEAKKDEAKKDGDKKDEATLGKQDIKLTELKNEGRQASYVGDLSQVDSPYKGGKKHKPLLYHMEAGKTYQIEMKSGVFIPYIYLEDADGIQLADRAQLGAAANFGPNDNGGAGAHMMVRVSRTGKHRIITTYLAGELGQFTLTAREADAAPAAAGPLAIKWVPELIGALRDTDAERRTAAALALGRIGAKAAKAVPMLMLLVADAQQPLNVRVEAAEALNVMGDNREIQEVIPEVLKVLGNSNEKGDVRVRMAWFFNRFVNQPATMQAAVLVMTKVCAEPAIPDSGSTRYHCAFLLGIVRRNQAPDSALNVLEQWLYDSTGKLYSLKDASGKATLTGDSRIMAVDALGFIGAERVRKREEILKQLRVIIVDNNTLPLLRKNVENLLAVLEAAPPTPKQKDAGANKVVSLNFENGQARVNASLNDSDAKLPAEKPFKEYSFTGDVGKICTINLQIADFFAYLYLKDDNGMILAMSDSESGKTRESHLVYEIKKTGTYHIIATVKAPRFVGKFLLTVALTDAAAAVATTTKAGLKYIELKSGTGNEAKAGYTVTLNYTGTFKDGKKFESSVGNAPTTFVLGKGKVIKGWEEGVIGMKEGGTRKLIIPPELGYGPRGDPERGVPANAELHYEMELLKVIEIVELRSKKDAKPKFEFPKSVAKLMLDKAGRIGAAGGSNVYDVTLEGGKIYVIDMKQSAGSSVDPYLQLFDPTGKRVAFDDDGGVGLNARITHKAVQAGRYRIIASGFGNSTGDYTLTLKRN